MSTSSRSIFAEPRISIAFIVDRISFKVIWCVSSSCCFDRPCFLSLLCLCDDICRQMFTYVLQNSFRIGIAKQPIRTDNANSLRSFLAANMTFCQCRDEMMCDDTSSTCFSSSLVSSITLK